MAGSSQRTNGGSRQAAAKRNGFRPQDLVLTLLGTYMRGDRQSVWSGGIVELMSEFGFSTGAARVAVTRLADRDLICRTREGRFVYYQLSQRARSVIADGDRRIFSLGEESASSSWTMVWHEIPEARRVERGKLARRMRFLGFGSLKDGLWVSPHDHRKELTTLLDDLEITNWASVMVGNLAGEGGAGAMLSRAWDLEALCSKYRDFAAEFGAYGSSRRSGISDGEAFLIRTRLIHVYRDFLVLDPGVEDAMMPDPGARVAAVEVFNRVYDALEAPAQRHFDRVDALHGKSAATTDGSRR